MRKLTLHVLFVLGIAFAPLASSQTSSRDECDALLLELTAAATRLHAADNALARAVSTEEMQVALLAQREALLKMAEVTIRQDACPQFRLVEEDRHE